MLVEHFVCETPTSISRTTHTHKKRKLAVGYGPMVEELLSVAGPGVRLQSQPHPVNFGNL